MHLGTTFDPQQAESFGLNPIETLEEIINLGINPIRIGIKWSRVEEKKDHYDWSLYDQIVGILQKKNAPIILTIGMKAPRWPEFYIPEWLNPLQFHRKYQFNLHDTQIEEALFKFIKEAINHFRTCENIIYWQLENEPFMQFGPHLWSIDSELLKNELELVKSLSTIPVFITSPGLPTTGLMPEFFHRRFRQKSMTKEIADAVGLNIFPRFESIHFGRPHLFKASRMSWWYVKKWIQNIKKTKPVWISELQAEPWQLSEVNLTDAYAHPTCNPDLVSNDIRRLQTSGIEGILLWGCEFHLACAKAGNKEWLQLYKQI